MKAPTRGREKLSDRIARNAAAFELLRPPGVERVNLFRLDDKSLAMKAMVDKVAKVKVPSTVPHESTVQRDIIEYLKAHDNVRAVSRINSGVMKESDRFIRMNTVYGKQNGMHMRMADIQAIHWPSGRLIAVECKRPGWKRPSSTREHEQAAYIECVRESGGIAFFATSVDDVKRLLP